MPRQELSERARDELYAQAERLVGTSAAVLQEQAKLAYENRKNGPAMRLLSFCWDRNARLMARAVVRWPEWFMPSGTMPARATQADECLALFAMAQLPLEQSNVLNADWRRYSWKLYQVREKVDEWRKSQRDPNRLQLRVRKAQVIRLSDAAAENIVTHAIVIGWDEGEAPSRKWLRRGLKVKVVLEEEE